MRLEAENKSLKDDMKSNRMDSGETVHHGSQLDAIGIQEAEARPF